MAQVTDLEYSLENRLIQKLDLMIDRCTKPKPIRDSWMICEGGEGEGKTNASLAIAYYVKWKTGRDIHMFLSVQQAMDFGKTTEKKIIVIDEPSLDSLKGDANNKLNRDFKRFMAVCRMKQHFVISNLTRFYIFNEYLVVDRCLGMVHMYSRGEVEPGRFVYIKKSRLEMLYRVWNSKHIRAYKEHKSFGGSFPEIMEKHFDKLDLTINGKPHCTYKDYNQIKGLGVASIGEEKKSKKDLEVERKLNELRYKIVKLIEFHKLDKESSAAFMGIDTRRFREWVKYGQIQSIPLGKPGFEPMAAASLITIGGNNQENLSNPSEDIGEE